jgi:hypothetical protein
MEFESGSETQVTVGGGDEVRTRRAVMIPLPGKAPHVNFVATVSARRDHTVSEVAYTGGRSVSKAKSVEAADFFTGDVHYEVGFSLRYRSIFPVNVRQLSVSVPVHLAFPRRDTLAAPLVHFDVPERIKEQLRLSGSDVVLDVYGVAPHLQPRGSKDRGVLLSLSEQAGVSGRIDELYESAQPSHGMADILAATESDGRAVYGMLWPDVRHRIMAEVDLTRLQQDLKSMMAGTPIVVQVDRGRVLVTASVLSMRHRNNVASSEFNTGTEFSAATAHTAFGDGVSGHGTSTAAGMMVQAYTTTDPIGHLPLKGRAGGGIGGQLGFDDAEVGLKSSKSGVTTKSKLPAAVFDGLADLRFRFEHQPLLGAERVRFSQATVGFQALVEQGEARAVPARPEPFTDLGINRPGRAPSAARDAGPGADGRPGEVRVPPTRVWSRSYGQGLGDTDVVRALPDTSGFHGAMDVAGRQLFGRHTWARIGRLVQDSVSNARLATLLKTMTRGEQVLSPAALNRLLDKPAEITATARIVQLRYLRTDRKAELNPASETTDQRTRTNPRWWAVDGRGQAGLEAELPFFDMKAMADLIVGGQYRERSAATATLTGRAVANGKFATPTAIYDGFTKITVCLRYGGRTEEVSGVVPLEVGIPLAETSGAPADQHAQAIFSGPRTRTSPQIF